MVRLVLLGFAIVLFIFVALAPADALGDRGGRRGLRPRARSDHGATLLAGVIQSEARTRALLVRPKAENARSCIGEKQRRLRRLVRRARRARRRGATGRVQLTRAYLEAVILADEACRCGRVAVPGVPPGKTLVTVEVDPSRAPRRGPTPVSRARASAAAR